MTIAQIRPVPAPDLVGELPPAVDLGRFTAVHGRPPLPAEVGCALAHLESCAILLAGRDDWALVLEDDAVVADAHRLEQRAREVIAAWAGRGPLVYSFFTLGRVMPGRLPLGPVAGSLRLPVAVGSAVGYLFNRSAAALILESQRPVWSVADWPVAPPDLAFCLDQSGLVGHREAVGSASTIAFGARDPRELPWSVKAQIWSGIWFLRNRRHFEGPADYRRRVLSRRVFFHRHMRR
jgi:hypothetical protein